MSLKTGDIALEVTRTEVSKHNYVAKKEEDLYCPSCGRKAVWEFRTADNIPMDPYTGTEPWHACVSCKRALTVHQYGRLSGHSLAIVEELRRVEDIEP